jgi:benzoyl-CoA reductase/2-hydroxyglutaryl-CoA dehydratase subunit BcrC/BadD/HgdB
MSEGNQGLTRAKDLYRDRFRRAKELKQEGKKILGYLCLQAPLEMISAFQIIPFRMFGKIDETPTQVDRFLPRAFCPFVRSVFDLSLKGKYDFLDGMILVHSCDPMERTGRIWESVMEHPYFYFMDLPTKVSERHQNFFREGLDDFRKTLEELTGKELSLQELKKAIEKHNEQRGLVRSLYEMTEKVPPKISGSEILQIIGAITSIPVEDGNKLLREVLAEIGKRKSGRFKGPRILVWGSILDHPVLIKMMEDLGAHVVMDDLCTGTRGYWTDVKLDGDLLGSLAYHYLVELKCPRTFKEAPSHGKRKSYSADLEERFGYLRELAKTWKVDGAILQSVKYCDCHGFEVPQVKDYFDSLGIRSLLLEHNYMLADREVLKTRVEAFLEILQGGVE